MDRKIENFGSIKAQNVSLITLTNGTGHQVRITNFGGIVHSWFCPDKHGVYEDILLGCPDLNGYTERHPYFGAIVGRYANRIRHGQFELDGVTYRLPKNLPPHHLHGGEQGFDRKIWKFEVVELKDRTSVVLTTVSEHMEEGYPGELDLKVTYTFTDENELVIEYWATTDRKTHINLTNHCYFNLSGRPGAQILDHEVRISASHYTESDEELIPTGKISPVADTVLDFTDFHLISERIFMDNPLLKVAKGYDHNYVIDPHSIQQPVAEARHILSGRRLQVFSDQPGIQLYAGNWLGGVHGKGVVYSDFAGLCLETQHFPDTPHHPGFPTTILIPGETFYSKSSYKIDTVKG